MNGISTITYTIGTTIEEELRERYPLYDRLARVTLAHRQSVLSEYTEDDDYNDAIVRMDVNGEFAGAAYIIVEHNYALGIILDAFVVEEFRNRGYLERIVDESVRALISWQASEFTATVPEIDPCRDELVPALRASVDYLNPGRPIYVTPDDVMPPPAA